MAAAAAIIAGNLYRHPRVGWKAFPGTTSQTSCLARVRVRHGFRYSLCMLYAEEAT